MMMVRSSVFVLLAFLSILSASSLVSAAHTSHVLLEAIDNDLTWFQEQGWNSLYEDPDENRFLVSRWQDKPVLVIEGIVGLPAKVRFKGFKVRVTETTEKPVSIFRTSYGAGR